MRYTIEATKKEANVLQTYEELKTKFENHACRVDDVLLYPVLDTKNESTLYTLLQLKERFSHLKYSEGKTEHKFVQEWADDPNKKAFRKMDVVPKNCPPDVYNLWDGYDIKKKKFVSEETGDIQPFLDLLWDMSGGEESVQEYLLKWIAFLFQNPEKKPKRALVFQSKEGSGKNEFWGFIGKLMGKATYLETSNAERDIFEKHSLALQGRKLVFINEMNKNIHKNYEDRMKGLITDVSLYLRPLHKQSFEVDNLAGFILAGNSRLLVLVKKEERRFVLVEVRGEYLPNTPNHGPFWSNWFRWKKEEQNQRQTSKWLIVLTDLFDQHYSPKRNDDVGELTSCAEIMMKATSELFHQMKEIKKFNLIIIDIKKYNNTRPILLVTPWGSNKRRYFAADRWKRLLSTWRPHSATYCSCTLLSRQYGDRRVKKDASVCFRCQPSQSRLRKTTRKSVRANDASLETHDTKLRGHNIVTREDSRAYVSAG